MSCFVAIPSKGDTDAGRFRRLGQWDIKTEIIQIRGDGTAARGNPANCRYDGLLVVGRAFLEQDAAAKLLLLRADVNPMIDGVFIHPGVTNAPGKKEVVNVFDPLPNGLSALANKAVAFTHTGFAKYQVHCLHELWEWLASPAIEGEEHKAPGFDIESLEHDFARLFQLSGRPQLVELFILAEGCVEGQLKEAARKEFQSNLLLELNGKASWLQKDEYFKEPVSAILNNGGDGNPKETLDSLIAAIRSFFKA